MTATETTTTDNQQTLNLRLLRRDLSIQALNKFNGNKVMAAAAIGISLRSLASNIDIFNIWKNPITGLYTCQQEGRKTIQIIIHKKNEIPENASKENLNIDYHRKQILLKALNLHRGRRPAARALGISERTVIRWIKQFDIKRECWGEGPYYVRQPACRVLKKFNLAS